MSNEIWLANGTDGLSGIPGPMRQELGPHGFNLLFLGIVAGIYHVLHRNDPENPMRADLDLRAFRPVALSGSSRPEDAPQSPVILDLQVPVFRF